jgi:hypothetical protein
MNIRAALLAIVASSVFSAAALAAAGANGENHPGSRPQMADLCSVLESQYNTVIGSHPDAAQAGVATDLASTGTNECNSNEGDLGVRKLEQALLDVGVTPSL